ncbi:hypothetical protein CRD_01593 [Raphidiopsis brookii D9]|nr:hypothetical protein CRD_01593 [Raphidiopsis brookii D9]
MELPDFLLLSITGLTTELILAGTTGSVNWAMAGGFWPSPRELFPKPHPLIAKVEIAKAIIFVLIEVCGWELGFDNVVIKSFTGKPRFRSSKSRTWVCLFGQVLTVC